jgi:GTP cyclohydrolase I
MKSNKATVKVMTPKADARIAPLVKQILESLGEDAGREGLVRTPERVERALQFLTSGYGMDVNKVVNGALFAVKYDEMVIMRDIEFFSMCEHHMLPFFGKVHVAYIPRDRVIGLSKLPRLVDVFARRLQIQERMTQQIAQTIQESGGGGGDLPGAALLHDDARRGEATFRGRDQRDAGRVPGPERDTRRIPGLGEVAHALWVPHIIAQVSARVRTRHAGSVHHKPPWNNYTLSGVSMVCSKSAT